MRLALYASVFVTGCSTHRVALNYQVSAPAQPRPSPIPAIAVGQFADQRGDDAKRGDNGNWFGAVRGGYGNSIKTVLADEPVRDVVAGAFAQALRARGVVPDQQGATYLLGGAVKRFACKQYVRRDCTVKIDVVISDRSSRKEVFSKSYEADASDGSIWALDTGVFGSADKLQDLAARTLTKCIDKALDDPALADVTRRSFLPGSAEAPRRVEERLAELKRLLDQGMISEKEYERKRATILDDL
jgi:hypothetical protein